MAYVSLKAFKAHPEKFSKAQVSYMCRNQQLSKKFMKEYAKYLNWKDICLYQPKVDEDFIAEMADYVDWEAICTFIKHPHFSEEFMEKFKDKIEWGLFSRYNTSFTKEFVLSHMDYINLNTLVRNESISKEIRNIEVVSEFLRHNPRSFDWTYPYFDDITFEFVREFQHIITTWRHIVTKFKDNMYFHDEFHKYYTATEWAVLSSNLSHFTFDFIIKYSDSWDYDTNLVNLPIFATDTLYITREEADEIYKFWFTMKNKPK